MQLNESVTANLDLRFEMCIYFEIEHFFDGLYITNGSDQDWNYIKSRYSRFDESTKSNSELFTIISNNKKFYIVANSCVIDTNNLMPNMTSIASNGKY